MSSSKFDQSEADTSRMSQKTASLLSNISSQALRKAFGSRRYFVEDASQHEPTLFSMPRKVQNFANSPKLASMAKHPLLLKKIERIYETMNTQVLEEIKDLKERLSLLS